MPEGLEIFVVAKVLKNLGIQCKSIGKHLLYKDTKTGQLFDMSFGLYGSIHLHQNLSVEKVSIENKPCGYLREIGSFDDVSKSLGVDWMTMSKDDAILIIRSWTHRKKMISSLLTDQHEISGIGSFWVSMICSVAIVDPKLRANMLELFGLVDPLANAIIRVRDVMVKQYFNLVTSNEIDFVNNCFRIMYAHRSKCRPIDFSTT